MGNSPPRKAAPQLRLPLPREVYRVTESLQREKSGLLKQLDFLRCVRPGCVLRVLSDASTRSERPELLRGRPHSPGPRQLSTTPSICLIHLHTCPHPPPVYVSAGSLYLVLWWDGGGVLSPYLAGFCSSRRGTEFIERLLYDTYSISSSTKLGKGGQLLIRELTIEETDITEMTYLPEET